MGHDLVLLLIAAGLGGAVGLEREFGAQPAGFRTHVLVSLGAALFTVAGADATDADPTRVAATWEGFRPSRLLEYAESELPENG